MQRHEAHEGEAHDTGRRAEVVLHVAGRPGEAGVLHERARNGDEPEHEQLGDQQTGVAAGRALVRDTARRYVDGADRRRGPSVAKLFCTEMQARVVDRCLQLFGGYGYMMEYPIARLYTDARVARIYAGTSEVMKVIIAKSLGL